MSKNPFLMDDLLIISALDDTQTHQEGNSFFVFHIQKYNGIENECITCKNMKSYAQ